MIPAQIRAIALAGFRETNGPYLEQSDSKALVHNTGEKCWRVERRLATSGMIAELGFPHKWKRTPFARRLWPPILAQILKDCRDTEAQLSIEGLSPKKDLLMNMDDLASVVQSPLQSASSIVENLSRKGCST